MRVTALMVCLGLSGALACAGEQGPEGKAGPAGPAGRDGRDGTDGQDGANGEDGVDGADGADGNSALVRLVEEPAGSNCAGGGVKVLAGVDLDGDGRLGDAEVSSTSFVCSGASGSDGEDGAPGQDGLGVLIATDAEPPGLHCPGGGTAIRSGVDADRDGVLEPAEVSSTSYLCEAPPPVVGACDGVVPLIPGASTGNTLGSGDHFSGCTLRDSTGAPFVVGLGAEDALWSLRVTERQRVTIHVRGFDSALYLLEGATCDVAQPVYGACRDASADDSETLSLVLDPGQYWVVVDGWSGSTVPTAGAYTITLDVEEACGATLPAGRCEGPDTAEWCIVPPPGIATDRYAFTGCRAEERCREVEGQAHCFIEPTATTCREAQAFCRDANTLATCPANGAVTTATCAFGCVERIAGAYCRDSNPKQPFAATFRYQYRRPRADLSDWSEDVRDAPVQRAMVMSLRWTGSEYVALDTAVTDEHGRFTVDVLEVPGPDDVVALFAAFPRPLGGGIAFAVAEPAVADGVIQPGAFTEGQMYFWTLSPYTTGSNHTFVITEQLGSGALRVFDGMRVVYENSAQLYYRDLHAKSMVVWMRHGSSWTCGECMAPVPTNVLGGNFETQMFINGSSVDAEYWADSVTFHEVGHWTMASFGVSPQEGGPHFLGIPYFPGMAWSEGWATFVSSDWRTDSRYIDKQRGAMFWMDIGERRHGQESLLWPRPVPSDGLLGRIYENEVASMLWHLAQDVEVTSNPLYRALASPRALQARRGYTRRTWDVDNTNGQPINVVDTGEAAVALPDFLDAVVCGGEVANAAQHINAVTEPATHYAYPSNAPICN